jgi:hypothetical protein
MTKEKINLITKSYLRTFCKTFGFRVSIEYVEQLTQGVKEIITASIKHCTLNKRTTLMARDLPSIDLSIGNFTNEGEQK